MNKLFGPSSKNLKNQMNKKLRKKMRQKQDQEIKAFANRIEENEKNVYNFLEDFSSSDYDSVSEEELDMMPEDSQLSDSHSNFEFGYMRGGGKRDHSRLTQSEASFTTTKSKGIYPKEQLLKTYKRFEKRKILKRPKTFQNGEQNFILRNQDLDNPKFVQKDATYLSNK